MPTLPSAPQADANTARQMAVPVGAWLWQPKGCPECNFIGYRGRTGIHELLLIDDRVRAAIHRGENEITLIQQLGPAGKPCVMPDATKRWRGSPAGRR